MSRKTRLVAAANKRRTRTAAQGFCDHAVYLRRITYTGRSQLLGTKGSTSVTDIVIPTALVEEVSLRQIQYGAGVLEAGDIVISGIPRDTANDVYMNDNTVQWLVAGPQTNGTFTVIEGQATLEPTGWRLVVRARQ